MPHFKALLIGASDYDAPGLPPLPFVRADLKRLAGALRSRGFETVDVAESPRGVTPNFVEGKISRLLSGAGRNDVLLIALSGHGIHIDGADYLLPEDADLDIVDRTGIKIDWARDLENTLAQRVVFLIDACREGVDLGTMSSSDRSWGTRKSSAAMQRKVAYVYACSPAQVALYVRNDEAIEDSAAVEAVQGDSFSLFSRAAADVVGGQPQVSSLDDLEDLIQRRIGKLHRAYAKKRPLQRVRVLTDVDKRDFHVLPTPAASTSGPSRVSTSRHEESTITKLLATAGLGQVEILKDVDLPLSSMRATLVLAGHHPVTRDPSYIVVELKDWTSVQPYEGSSTLCQVDGGTSPTLNPVEEVRGYRSSTWRPSTGPSSATRIRSLAQRSFPTRRSQAPAVSTAPTRAIVRWSLPATTRTGSSTSCAKNSLRSPEPTRPPLCFPGSLNLPLSSCEQQSTKYVRKNSSFSSTSSAWPMNW